MSRVRSKGAYPSDHEGRGTIMNKPEVPVVPRFKGSPNRKKRKKVSRGAKELPSSQRRTKE